MLKFVDFRVMITHNPFEGDKKTAVGLKAGSFVSTFLKNLREVYEYTEKEGFMEYVNDLFSYLNGENKSEKLKKLEEMHYRHPEILDLMNEVNCNPNTMGSFFNMGYSMKVKRNYWYIKRRFFISFKVGFSESKGKSKKKDPHGCVIELSFNTTEELR